MRERLSVSFTVETRSTRQAEFVFNSAIVYCFYNCLLDAVLICLDHEEKELSFFI